MIDFYRLHPRRLISRLYGHYRDVVNALRSFRRYRKAVAKDVEWDYEGIYDLLLVKLEGIVEQFEHYDIGYHSKASAREMAAHPDQIGKCGKPEELITDRDREQEQYSRENILAQRKSAAAARVCLKVLKRITDDWYADTFVHINGDICVEGFAIEDRLRKRDRTLMFSLMSEHIEGWWT